MTVAVQLTTLDAQPVVAVRPVRRVRCGTGRRPYPDLGEAYQVTETWLTDAGRSAGGAPWESYVVAPDDVDHDPARQETLVCWPLA